MPLYTYKCGLCSKKTSAFRKILERNRNPSCAHCQVSGRMERILEAPAVVGDYAPYNCPITGQLIEGRKAHIENLHKHGCRVLEPGETEEVKRNRAQADVDFETRLEQDIETEIASMPPRKHEKLVEELVHGMALEVKTATPYSN